MNDLSKLTNEELLTVHTQAQELYKKANITIPWMNVPDTPEWDKFVELTHLAFWRDRVIKPIDAINIFKDIKEEMSNRWVAEHAASVDEKIKLAV